MNGRNCPRTRATTFWTVASIALLSLAVTVSAKAATGDAAFDAAYRSFAKAAAGDDSAIDAAARAFESLRAAEPANPVVVAYAGASTTMRAKTRARAARQDGARRGRPRAPRQVARHADAGARRADRARHARLARGPLRRRQHLPRRAVVHEPRRARQEAARRRARQPAVRRRRRCRSRAASGCAPPSSRPRTGAPTTRAGSSTRSSRAMRRRPNGRGRC